MNSWAVYPLVVCPSEAQVCPLTKPAAHMSSSSHKNHREAPKAVRPGAPRVSNLSQPPGLTLRFHEGQDVTCRSRQA
jgi:hypothetical protein